MSDLYSTLWNECDQKYLLLTVVSLPADQIPRVTSLGAGNCLVQLSFTSDTCNKEEANFSAVYAVERRKL